MELIKQIKDAEKQAKEIVDKAKQEAAALLEDAKIERAGHLKQAQQRRHEAIDKAVADAQNQGASQLEQLSKQGDQEIAALKESSSVKIQACVNKVVSHLQQAL